MFFGGEHVAEADPHYCSTAQFCLRKIRAPGRVNLLYDVAVDLVDAINGVGAPSRRCARRGRRGSKEAKTHDAHANRR